MVPVDLFSDTHTLPTAAMRSAMANALVGDEQMGEDPTTRLLQDRVAELLDTEAALFLPTGSMCNKVGVAALTRPGDAVICDSMAHVLRFEGGGSAVLSGVVFEPLATEKGWFTPDQVEAVPIGGNVYQPRSALVTLENTNNFGGGTVWPIDVYEAVCATARERGSAVFTDGARLLNASAASGIVPSRWAASVDGLWIDLSKGLGCPGGAVLAGSAGFIAEANRFKYMFGGGLRQSGILAAAGVYALDHHLDRLTDDHVRAARFAEGLAALGYSVETPETNMAFFDPTPVGLTASEAVTRFVAQGVRVSVVAGRIRAVTHLDVDDAGIDAALAVAAGIAAASANSTSG